MHGGAYIQSTRRQVDGSRAKMELKLVYIFLIFFLRMIVFSSARLRRDRVTQSSKLLINTEMHPGNI